MAQFSMLLYSTWQMGMWPTLSFHADADTLILLTFGTDSGKVGSRIMLFLTGF